MSADQTHIKLEFNRQSYAGPENIVEVFAMSEDTMRLAQKWQEQQKKLPEAAQSAGWIVSHGGALDRADGPAFVRTDADGFKVEEWYRQRSA
jgi:hypothetical protein